MGLTGSEEQLLDMYFVVTKVESHGVFHLLSFNPIALGCNVL